MQKKKILIYFITKNGCDILYTGLNITFSKALMVHSKIKGNEKCALIAIYISVMIQLCGDQIKPNLTYLLLFIVKKETKKAVIDGLLNECKADPNS